MAKAKKVVSIDVGSEGYIAVLDKETGVLRKATDTDVSSGGAAIGEELLYVTPITPERIEEIRKENKRKELLAKQEALRQEMIDAGIEPPPIAVVQQPRQVRQAEQAPQQVQEAQQPRQEETITVQQTETGGEVITLPGGIVKVEPLKAPKLPINPQTGRPYSEMEFRMVYERCKQEAERNESVVCVDCGPGYFIIRTNDPIQMGRFYAGVPLVQQGLRSR